MADHAHTAARLDDLADGKITEVTIDGTPVALAREGDRVFATQAKCPHYNLPLKDGGTIVDGRIRCPYHMSCFRASDGVVVEPPALDGLVSFPCRVEAGEVIVTVPSEKAKQQSELPPMPRKQATSRRHVVIVGNGAGGYAAAQRLCELGFDGRVTMLADDPTGPLPYDRPSLSKAYFTGDKPAEKLTPRDKSFFDEHAIELSRGRAIGIDRAAKRIKLADGGRLDYDVAILAPGSKPKTLDVPGGDLARVLTLRSRVDCEQILGTLKKLKTAVVVGSSFIGMEVAAGLRKRGVDVIVASPSKVPFASVLGEQVGAMFQRAHEKEGVRFHMGRKVTRVEGKTQAERVVLDDGTTIACDAVIVGVGVEPATDWTGLPLTKDGGIEVDATMKVAGADDLYAVGDAARAPDPRTGKPVRIEHWRVAQQHGKRAAAAIAGRDEPIVEPPYFWSNQYKLSLHYVGHASSTDDVRIDGTSADDFLAEYFEDGELRSIASVGRKAEVMRRIEAMRK